MNVPLTPLRCLERALDLFAHKTGLVCGERTFTYAEFGTRCRQLASALARRGIAYGDRVAYLSYNTHKLLEGYYGVVQAGAIVMPLNVRLSPLEFITILNHSGAKMVLFEDDFAGAGGAAEAAVPGGTATGWRWMRRTRQADFCYEELLADGTPRRPTFSVDENAVAELFYTSGSTGTPKGVDADAPQSVSACAVCGGEHSYSAESRRSAHDSAVPRQRLGRPQSSTMLGFKQVMVRRFEPTAVFRLIEEHKATEMSLVPTMANMLLNAPELADYDLSSLKRIMLGGAASSPELIARLEAVFHCRSTPDTG